MNDKLTPEQKIILMQRDLLKCIKKTLPHVRNKYNAKELYGIATAINIELKKLKNIGLERTK